MMMVSDTGTSSILVMLDLSAVFDAVDHFILPNRLRDTVGISVTALD